MVQAPTHLARHAIGKGGATLNDVKKKHHVQIHTTNKEEGCSFAITGEPQNIKAARDDLQKIIQSAERKTRRKDGRKVCRFYLAGKCKFGTECRNEHPGEADETGKTRDPSPQPGFSGYRRPAPEESDPDDDEDEPPRKRAWATPQSNRKFVSIQ